MGEYTQEGLQTSKLNSGSLNNLRLHNLWEDCNRFAPLGKFPQWNATLDRVWEELSGDVKENDKTHTKFRNLSGDVTKAGALQNTSSIEGFKKMPYGIKLILAKQYQALMLKTFIQIDCYKHKCTIVFN